MRSILWQCLDLLGPSPNAEDLVNLFVALSEATAAQIRAQGPSAAYLAADGRGRVRIILASATVMTDGTEPAHVYTLLSRPFRSGAMIGD